MKFLKSTLSTLVLLAASSNVFSGNIVVDKSIERALAGNLSISNCNEQPKFKIDNNVIPSSKVYLEKTVSGYKYRARYVASRDYAIIEPFFSDNSCKGKWEPKQKKVDLRFKIINHNNINFKYTSGIIVDKTIERALAGELKVSNCRATPRIRIDNKVIPLSKVYLKKTVSGYKYRARYVASRDYAIIEPFFSDNTCKGKWEPRQKKVDLRFKIINHNNINFLYSK